MRAKVVISRSGVWLLAGAFFFLPLNGVQRVVGIPIGDLLLGVALILAVVLWLIERKLPSVPVWLALGVGLFIAAFLLSEIFSSLDAATIERLFPYGNDSARASFVKLIVCLGVLPVLVLSLAPRWPAIQLLAAAWVLGVGVSCFAAVLDAYLGFGIEPSLASNREQVEWWIGFMEPKRYPGLSAHPNSLGISAVLVAPVLLAQITNSKRLYVGLPLVLLLSWGVLLSGSRGALVGFLLVVVAVIVLFPYVRKTILSPRPGQVTYQLALLIVFLLISFPSLIPELGEGGNGGGQEGEVSMASPEQAGQGGNGGGQEGAPASISRLDAGSESAEASNLERRKILENTLELIAERPLSGNGFELIQTAHTVYLQPLVAGGLLGLGGFLLVWFGFVRTGFRLWRTGSGPEHYFALALLISICAYLVMGLVINGILDRFLYLAPSLLLALAGALGLATRSGYSRRKPQFEKSP